MLKNCGDNWVYKTHLLQITARTPLALNYLTNFSSLVYERAQLCVPVSRG